MPKPMPALPPVTRKTLLVREGMVVQDHFGAEWKKEAIFWWEWGGSGVGVGWEVGFYGVGDNVMELSSL